MTGAPRPRTLDALLARAATLAGLLVGLGAAAAHATIVFGTLTVEPNPPPAGEAFEIRLAIDDPTGAPVEDAVVLAEFAPAAGADLDPDPEPLAAADFRETDPGVYRAEIALPDAGLYRVVLRDRTFRQEEAIQIVTLEIGGEEPVEPIDFIFPPTATGTDLRTWLVWLIAIPLAAGIVVTILVLRSGPGTGPGGPAADSG